MITRSRGLGRIKDLEEQVEDEQASRNKKALHMSQSWSKTEYPTPRAFSMTYFESLFFVGQFMDLICEAAMDIIAAEVGYTTRARRVHNFWQCFAFFETPASETDIYTFEIL